MSTMDFINALLGILSALATATVMAVSTLFGSFSAYLSVTNPPNSAPVVEETSPATSSPTVSVSSTTTQTQPEKTTGPVKEAASVAKPISNPIPQAQNLTPAIDPETLNAQTRDALVNILCTTKYGGYFKPISGSGVIVDTRGVVLTNAHVAQFFLLRDYLVEDNVDCIIRGGSPARAMYHAELLYLPPAWVAANASQIAAEQATGTGEDDYAFLRITDTTGPSVPFPTIFPVLAMTGATPEPGEEMLLAAYPAGFLTGQLIALDLYMSSAYTAVQDLFAFHDLQQVDLFSIGGTVVSQSGSSGGAAVRAQDGKLAGIIVTSSVADSTAERDLRAITISHINRSLAAEGQGGLVELLQGDLAAKAQVFASTTAPIERAELIEAIESR